MVSEHREIWLTLPSLNGPIRDFIAIVWTNTNASWCLFVRIFVRNHRGAPGVCHAYIMYYSLNMLYALIRLVDGFLLAEPFTSCGSMRPGFRGSALLLPNLLTARSRLAGPAQSAAPTGRSGSPIFTESNRLEP